MASKAPRRLMLNTSEPRNRFLFSYVTEHRVRFVYTYRKLQCINKRRYLSRLVLFIYHRHLKTKYGLEINPNVKIGVGLQIAHPYNIADGDLNEEEGRNVLCSIKLDVNILKDVSKIISMMLTANQALLMSSAINLY